MGHLCSGICVVELQPLSAATVLTSTAKRSDAFSPPCGYPFTLILELFRYVRVWHAPIRRREEGKGTNTII